MDCQLGDATTDAVLERMGLDHRPEPTLHGLRELYRHWCLCVPFDNLLKRIYLSNGSGGEPPGDRAESFFASWLAYGTGGTCWASSNALYALLRALGFDARRVFGIMGARHGQTDPNHGTVVVELDGRDWLVDTSLLSHQVVPLQTSARSELGHHPAQTCRVEESPNGAWLVFWSPLHFNHPIPCLLVPTEPPPDEVELHANKALELSFFNFSTYARRNTPSEVLGVAFERKVTIDKDGAKTAAILDEHAMKSLLVDELGYAESIVDQLPSASPIPPPLAEILDPFLSSAR